MERQEGLQVRTVHFREGLGVKEAWVLRQLLHRRTRRSAAKDIGTGHDIHQDNEPIYTAIRSRIGLKIRVY